MRGARAPPPGECAGTGVFRHRRRRTGALRAHKQACRHRCGARSSPSEPADTWLHAHEHSGARYG
eukprot:6609977-Alexandrium_andersonii.AAC.1